MQEDGAGVASGVHERDECAGTNTSGTAASGASHVREKCMRARIHRHSYVLSCSGTESAMGSGRQDGSRTGCEKCDDGATGGYGQNEGCTREVRDKVRAESGVPD